MSRSPIVAPTGQLVAGLHEAGPCLPQKTDLELRTAIERGEALLRADGLIPDTIYCHPMDKRRLVAVAPAHLLVVSAQKHPAGRITLASRIFRGHRR